MPPRHAYWTILVDDEPTAFRAHDAEELIPTLNRLKQKHSSAVLKWFERGQLWDSRDDARAKGLGRGERRWEGPRPDRSEQSPPRDRNWRPGGDHRDPRQKYKDAKKAKWARFKKNIRDRAERARGAPTSDADPRTFSPPHGDPLRSKTRREWQPGNRSDWKNRERPWSDRPPRDRERAERYGDRQQRARPKQRDQPRGQRDWRPEDRHQADRPGDRRKPRDRASSKSADTNRSGGKKPWGFKGGGPGGPPSRGAKGNGKGQRPRFRGQDQAGKRNPRGPRRPRKPRDDD